MVIIFHDLYINSEARLHESHTIYTAVGGELVDARGSAVQFLRFYQMVVRGMRVSEKQMRYLDNVWVGVRIANMLLLHFQSLYVM